MVKLTRYTGQRKIYDMAAKIAASFVKVQTPSNREKVVHCISIISVDGITAEIESGADEAIPTAMLRTMKSY